MFHIKTYNAISNKGLDRFNRELYQVSADCEQPDAVVLRSQSLHDQDLPSTVKAIARAGAGVNNVPVEACTKAGVVVFNTPGANANAVKELVLAGLLLSSRDITGGMRYVQSLTEMTDADAMGKLLEKEKKRFAGNELYGRTLGVVGLGAIGSMVAEMALALGMDVVGFDPALSVEAAWKLPSQVEKMDNLQALMARSDYITLHVPAIAPTRHMINAEVLQAVKAGAVLLNFARESIVDADAVVASLDEGRLGMYVCDFPEPNLLQRPDVLAMPHIGASTAEAEENCAVMAVDQLKDFLESGNIKNSVNFPQINLPRSGGYRITFVNDNVSGVLGNVLSVFTQNNINVLDMMNKSRDDIAYNILDVEQVPSAEVIKAIGDVEHVIAIRVLN
ncbi:phosphoglycerate dehydrogenase [Aestuariicella hydrocarbonica]|uniref:D-3-phosphoglycerate dehydrogenase n=1 Tax=Pseudomaricurvus hydrocarbonicus TaxID=1470433 RepID=A0A9E5MLS6_9GAMM|nr:phosphoglycerate dehydrogenase [Aestuariicella hydrocarbonica]NHO64535.1 phosphoglycerate dehydrogenase [Aestuariicella hydrocarbonica]